MKKKKKAIKKKRVSNKADAYERVLDYKQRWRDKNPEKMKMYRQRAYAKRKAAEKAARQVVAKAKKGKKK